MEQSTGDGDGYLDNAFTLLIHHSQAKNQEMRGVYRHVLTVSAFCGTTAEISSHHPPSHCEARQKRDPVTLLSENSNCENWMACWWILHDSRQKNSKPEGSGRSKVTKVVEWDKRSALVDAVLLDKERVSNTPGETEIEN
ncbi:hypothetical protein RRG08_060309 [Elysia crispata]|uniref:Uncharacterized protein n=1 Tax=Elysia crispata TaxID=231223 RepID=A0AAE0Y2Q7_9GAST|nr:hypothetical protein RRG08_060309 [Elysia crispata]